MIESLVLVRHLKKDAPREMAFYGRTDLPILSKSELILMIETTQSGFFPLYLVLQLNN